MGRCRDCPNEVENNRSMCRLCLDKAKNRANKRRIGLLEQKLCISCGKNNHLDNKELCDTCQNKKIKSSSSRKQRYKVNGKCEKCARSKSYVSLWYNLWCAGCHLKYKFGHIGTKEQAEKLINDMLEKQNYKCALTGRDLHTNKFHIDHIKPRSTHSELKSDPNNWQLTVEEVNIFKSDLTVEQIIALAKDIIEFRK